MMTVLFQLAREHTLPIDHPRRGTMISTGMARGYSFTNSRIAAAIVIALGIMAASRAGL